MKELPWCCGDSGHREAVAYYECEEYHVKMVVVATGGKEGITYRHERAADRPGGTDQ